MKLAFNGMNSGLGNNGGTRTILKCAEVLNDIGHECYVVVNVDNYTNFTHEYVARFMPENLDAIINVAAVDMSSTLNFQVPIKAWYIRGHESWANPEEELINHYKNREVKNIVNSVGLKQLLASYGADSEVVYQGIDFDKWEDKDLRRDQIVRIGCLYQTKSTKRWQDFVKLSKILGNDGYDYVSFGTSTPPDISFLKEFKLNADVEDLNSLYSSCDIWFAPTTLEGLHNVPMEAALCGCLIVCGDYPMNGMIYDYAFKNNTAMVYDRDNIEHAVELIKNPNLKLVSRMRDHLYNRIGPREYNMEKFVKILGGN